eukprot:530026-Lingulodinium_polyedra.AAC.1
MACGRIAPRAAPTPTRRAWQRSTTSPGSSRSTEAPPPPCSRFEWSRGPTRPSAPGATPPARP